MGRPATPFAVHRDVPASRSRYKPLFCTTPSTSTSHHLSKYYLLSQLHLLCLTHGQLPTNTSFPHHLSSYSRFDRYSPLSHNACRTHRTHGFSSSNFVFVLFICTSASWLSVYWTIRPSDWLWHSRCRLLFVPRNAWVRTSIDRAQVHRN
jgi:hypothetical protein